jgi:hypothetical protein
MGQLVCFMREISPATNVSAGEFLRMLPSRVRELVAEIRRQKQAGERRKPSSTVMDRSVLLTAVHRGKLLDAVAALVDENLAGRSEMCLQFADLVYRALVHLDFPARPALGLAMYFAPNGEELFRWKHAWVRIGDEVIDGNVDSLFENPVVPNPVNVAPYWGPIAKVPNDRRLREEHGVSLPPDTDVSNIWWPELKHWLDTEFLRSEAAVSEIA